MIMNLSYFMDDYMEFLIKPTQMHKNDLQQN